MPVDATKPVDSELVSGLPGFIRDTRTLVNANEAAIGGDYSRTVGAENSDNTFAVADLNQIFTVNSGSAVNLTLPVVTGSEAGVWLRVHKLGAGDVTLTPGGTDEIADGGAGVAIANSEAGEDKQAFIELECIGAGQWMISGILGTWS